jgi:WD domain, G-beta repeat
VAFWALAEIVRQRLAIAEEDPAEVAAAKLAEGLDRFVHDEAERAYVGLRLGRLLGVPVAGDGESALATASDDGTARLWDVATQQQIGTPMTAADTSLARLAFSPQGTILATAGGDAAGSDASAQLWDAAFPRDLVGAVCAIAGDTSLTRAEWAADVPSEPFEQACP